MNHWRILHVVFAAVLLVAPAALAIPPRDVAQDISELRIVRPFPTVSAMPQQLRRALARAFQTPQLELADPGARYKEMARIYFPGDPEAGLPERRLLFAFETPHFYFVYYEAGHPWHAAALAFSKSPRVKFVWGAADLKRPYAMSPAKLRARILHHKLLDGEKFIW